MKRFLIMMPLYLSVAICAADDVEKTPAVPPASITKSVADSNDASAAAAKGAAEAARFETDAQWKIAGYNNEEIIYTILVTSHDSRIIRCNTELKGSYFENGKKLSVSDRQLSTVFPDQQVQVGNWMGMDEKSGAIYSVKCHPL
jgi:hypothetical protein